MLNTIKELGKLRVEERQMKLGAAWYGFRQQTVSNYFEMVAALGLQSWCQG